MFVKASFQGDFPKPVSHLFNKPEGHFSFCVDYGTKRYDCTYFLLDLKCAMAIITPF
uniref:Uncharacterized protein n=1 Tax=Cercocebus atys TaxID=9531 RepID=A0A2K5L171_CERAT